MTISEFSKIVAALKTVYTAPGFVPNEQALDMWYRLVGKNNDYQTISVAAQMYMATGKFPPTPADILECASKLKRFYMQKYIFFLNSEMGNSGKGVQ
jgi:hypothetical protein